MIKQAIIYFKNGTKDWIDPIDENSIKYYDDIIVIDNGCFSYEYFKSLVDKIEVIEI
jgi:hypothetical protein